MQKFFTKLDVQLFKLTTKYILYRVRKTKKNKFFIFAGMYKKILFLWLFLAAVRMGLVAAMPGSIGEKVLIGSLVTFVAALWGGSAYFSFKDCLDSAQLYDFLFKNSDNPVVYSEAKRLAGVFWERGKQKRDWDLKFRAGFFVILLVIPTILTRKLAIGDALIFLDFICVGSMGLYKYAIFDMEPPKPKKRVKETMTEVMLKYWRDLIKSPLPNPA